MIIQSRFRASGVFRMDVYKNGRLIEHYTDHNVIVDGGRFQMARLLAGETENRHITHIAFGISGMSPDVADTEITQKYARPVSRFLFLKNNEVQFDWDLPVTENNGMAILEFGLLTADGMLFARKTRENPIHKESDISIEGHWTIIF